MKKLKFSGKYEPLTRNQMKEISGGFQTCFLYCCNENNGPVGSMTHGECPEQDDADELCANYFKMQGDGIRLCLQEDSCSCYS